MGMAGQWVSSPLGPPSRNRAGSTRVFSSPPSNTPTPSRRDTPLYATVGSRKVVEPLPDVDEVIEVEVLEASTPSSSEPGPQS